MHTTLLKKKKVLIVEDEADLCFILEIMLKDENTTIDHVKSLAAAREFLDSEKPDVLVLDNRLPDGLGLDFLPFLKSNYPEIRVIMISGKDKSANDLAVENGAHAFLVKPFTKKNIHDSIQSLLN